MKAVDLPARIPTPFANSAGGGFIRPIPVPSQIGIDNGAASFETGFPPANFTPVTAGGIPPNGQDFNGILWRITQWSRWFGAGGAVPWDSAFSAAVGGYPAGALVQSTTVGKLWLSIVDDNVTNPNAGGAGWQSATLLPQQTRIITSSAPQTLLITDQIVGLKRISAIGTMTLTVPNSFKIIGRSFKVVDLQGNFFAAPVTIAFPSGTTGPASATSWVLDQNLESATFTLFEDLASWSVER